MDEDDSFFLYTSVLFSRPKSILEIGHYLGKSTAAICQAIRESRLVTRFDSYDLPYQSSLEFEEYYSNVHKREVHAIDAYSRILDQGNIFTDVAKQNLKAIGLEKFVNLFAMDFRKSEQGSYDLIFADILHDADEIRHNLDDILNLGHPKTLYLFDDMKAENIHLVESLTPLRLIRKIGKIGAFYMV
jgi:predicted O-methyltransferase YrrM